MNFICIIRKKEKKPINKKRNNFFSSLTHLAKPKEVKIINSHKIMNAGVHYEIICESRGSHPAAKLIWLKDNIQLDSSSDTMVNIDKDNDNNNVSKIYLHFVPTFDDNGKSLTCLANNEHFPEFFLNQTIFLNVQCKY